MFRKPIVILLSIFMVISSCSFVFAQSCSRDFNGTSSCAYEVVLVRKFASNDYYEAFIGINASHDADDALVASFTDGCGADDAKVVYSLSDSNIVDDSDVQNFLDVSGNATRYQRVIFQVSDETRQFTRVTFKVPYSNEWFATSVRDLEYWSVGVQFHPTNSDDNLPITVWSGNVGQTTGCPGYSGPTE
jgi:hypothetical protein